MASPLDAHPDTATILGWIEEIVSWGVRRPCSRADERAISWIAGEFEKLGLEEVRLEPVEVMSWDPGCAEVELRRTGEGAPAEVLEGFPIPYCHPTRGVTASLAELDAQPVEGSIAWMPIDLIELSGPVMRAFATEVVDPDGAFDVITQRFPFSARGIDILEPIAGQGAVGLIGVLRGGFWETSGYYVPYDAVPRSIPGIWLSPEDGRRLVELARSDQITARMRVEGSSATGRSANVIGVLPGAKDDWVIVGTHHDAPWASAVEDASGMAMLLAQAAAWSAVPKADRPHNLLFLATAAHMAGGAGTAAFIADHEDQLASVVCELHLEHVARASKVDGGRLVPLAGPEVRWWFTTPHPDLRQLVVGSLNAEGIDRSLVLHPEVFGDHPTTDGGRFHLEGVPLVNLLSAPPYLFDPGDTVEMVHQESLAPLTRAVARIIQGLGAHTPRSLRTGHDLTPPPDLPIKF